MILIKYLKTIECKCFKNSAKNKSKRLSLIGPICTILVIHVGLLHYACMSFKKNTFDRYFGTARIDKVGLVITQEDQILRVRVMNTASHWVSFSYQLTAKWTLTTVTWIKDGRFYVQSVRI